jgi:RND family efflux transporter MFP subunit
MRARWWLVVGVVVVAIAGSGAYLMLRPASAAVAPTAVSVARGTYQTTVSATGTVQPENEADLDFAVAGTVTKVLVKAGEHVHKGQALARMDDTSLRAALTSATSSLVSANTAYSDDADAAATSTQLAADSASIDSARAAVAQAQDAVDNATLRSTITGTVAAVDLTVGESVGGSSAQAASDTSTTTYQVTVVSAKHFTVDATVAASDVASLKKGMQAQITPSGSTTTVYGIVKSIGLVAQTSNEGAAEFPVTIAVTGSPKDLYAGSSATVSIIVKQAQNVLAVPSLALHTSGKTTYVEKLVNGKPVRTTVTVGTTYGAMTQVLSGLKSGDQVQLPSFGGLTRPGTTGTNGTRGFGGTGFGGGLPTFSNGGPG